MKRSLQICFLCMAGLLIALSPLGAQEVQISVKVKEEGKLVKDTVYVFEDAEKAKHAVKVLALMSGAHEGEMEYVMKSSGHSGHAENMVFISEDGEKVKIKKIKGDTLVWTGEGHDHDHDFEKHVVVVSTGDGETIDIKVDKDHVHKLNKEENSYTIYMSDDDDVELEEKIVKKGEDGEVEVIVIKSKKKVKKENK